MKYTEFTVHLKAQFIHSNFLYKTYNYIHEHKIDKIHFLFTSTRSKTCSWLVNQGGGWIFAAKQGDKRLQLRTHSETPIVWHIKVQGNRSPFDGDWSYWASRMGKHPELPKQIAKLLKQQKGICSYCKLYFKSEDLLEVHHVDGNHQNHQWENLHYYTSIATTKFTQVCMISTQLLRSRMNLTVHVRFCRQVEQATVRLSLTLSQGFTSRFTHPIYCSLNQP